MGLAFVTTNLPTGASRVNRTPNHHNPTCAAGGATRELVKGAPEAVVPLTGAPTPAGLDEAVVSAAERGERVLLLAVREAGGPLPCLGLACLHDCCRYRRTS
jgi:hypothetical protein